ncbi:uncharacterized protein LOC143535507 [Bidens hawaiensis]|uniref:uncharacterized protein LOC143535507 n=1 Tax=Bidens hawaiensis TaxID=980011 RepID=UPI004049ACF5
MIFCFGDGNDEQSGYAYNDQREQSGYAYNDKPEQSGLPDLNELPELNHEPGYGNIEQYDLPNPDQGYIIYVGSHPSWPEDNRTSSNTYEARVEESYGQSSQQLHVGGPYYGTQNSYQLPLGKQPYMARPVTSNVVDGIQETRGEGGDDDVDVDYFESVAELVDWVKKTGREHGCVISVQRSRERSVELVCNRGGEPKLKGTVRHTGSIKRGCPFKLVGRYHVSGGCWKLKVVNETHNQVPVLFEEGHPALRKLTDEEIDIVATLHRQGLRAAQIKSAIKKRFPGNKCITRDIYNVVKLIDDQDKIGETPMQVLENFLQTHGFTFYTWENPSTNRTENVFFCHEKSHTIWRAFPYLLLIDTRWHIMRNIQRKHKSLFQTDIFKSFNYWWKVLYESPTKSMYDYNCGLMEAALAGHDRREAWYYIRDNWLVPYKERVEGQHANLKRYLPGPNNSLDSIAAFALEVVNSKMEEISATLEDSRVRIKKYHKLTLFDKLHNRVSLFAIAKLDTLQDTGAECDHRLQTSLGLPCACKLNWYTINNIRIPLKDIDPFWRKLDFSPAFVRHEETHYEAEMEDVKKQVLGLNNRMQKKSLFSKIMYVLLGKSNKEVPEKREDPRGRPNLNQQAKKRDTPRQSSYSPSPSTDTHRHRSYSSSPSTDPHRHSSYAPSPSFDPYIHSSYAPSMSFDPHRHSSYAPSLSREPTPKASSHSFSRSQSQSQARFKIPKPPKRSSKKQETPSDLGFPLLRDPKGIPIIESYRNLIPTWANPFISGIKDVKQDGNCGFRAIAVGLCMRQMNWKEVRASMRNEMDTKKLWWTHRLNYEINGNYDTVRDSLDYSTSALFQQKSRWFKLPGHEHVVAQTYDCVLINLHLTSSES